MAAAWSALWPSCGNGMQAKEAGDKRCGEIEVMLQEVDLRLAETKKDMYEFRRTIIGKYGQAALNAVLYATVMSLAIVLLR